MRAVGYIRVSTDQQVQDGVSLDAQRARLKAHCIGQDLSLVDIVTDNGYSAKSLERPGLRAAFRMLAGGKANTIVVVKLDRLTRSVKDLGHLCDTYFREGSPYYLMSVSDAIDTRSAGGKLILNVLMSVAQWEREAISERTKEAMIELRRQGVQMGKAPYGWRYSDDVNEKGHRYLLEDLDEQRGIRRVCELYNSDTYLREICATLDREGVPSRGVKWHKPMGYSVLRRAGHHDPEPSRKSEPSKLELQRAEAATIQRDPKAAAVRAVELRRHGLSLRQIGERLHGERFLPRRGNRWHAASVLELLRNAAESVRTQRPSSILL